MRIYQPAILDRTVDSTRGVSIQGDLMRGMVPFSV